ncbi:MAG: methylglyoxal synthase [Deltaproteobacteria bacterium]|nr:methylglyoxal synthase [Deltaproteobacteria bacterium]HCH64799.1 methylglyoxal synthase [Deltaproteobacteria bacterium]
MSPLVDALLDSPLKMYLSRIQVEQLATFMDVHSAEPDALIVRDGTPAEFVAVIMSGRADVVGKDVKMATLGDGRFFGESMFSHEAVRTADVRALESVTYAVLDTEDFERLLLAHRDVAMRCKAFFEALYTSNREKRVGDQTQYVALIAHNAMKPVLVDFAKRYRAQLETLPLVATGTTGTLLHRSTGLMLSRKVQSGPLGGDQAIGSLIASGNIQAVIFFRDPLSAHPHHADIEALGRLCDVYYVPFATNPSTAKAVLAQLEHGAVTHFANPNVDRYSHQQSELTDQHA